MALGLVLRKLSPGVAQHARSATWQKGPNVMHGLASIPAAEGARFPRCRLLQLHNRPAPPHPMLQYPRACIMTVGCPWLLEQFPEDALPSGRLGL
jgi:hypothetical protein